MTLRELVETHMALPAERDRDDAHYCPVWARTPLGPDSDVEWEFGDPPDETLALLCTLGDMHNLYSAWIQGSGRDAPGPRDPAHWQTFTDRLIDNFGHADDMPPIIIPF